MEPKIAMICFVLTGGSLSHPTGNRIRARVKARRPVGEKMLAWTKWKGRAVRGYWTNFQGRTYWIY